MLGSRKKNIWKSHLSRILAQFNIGNTLMYINHINKVSALVPLPWEVHPACTGAAVSCFGPTQSAGGGRSAASSNCRFSAWRIELSWLLLEIIAPHLEVQKQQNMMKSIFSVLGMGDWSLDILLKRVFVPAKWQFQEELLHLFPAISRGKRDIETCFIPFTFLSKPF